MSSFPNPSYVSWNPKIQSNYILNAYKIYVKKHGDPTLAYAPARNLNWDNLNYEYEPKVPHEKKEETLSWLYLVGYENGSLSISYSEFENAILYGGSLEKYYNYRRNKDKPYFRYFHRKDTYWYDSHSVYYREQMSYKKRSNHSKKVCSEKELNQKDWRERKGFRNNRVKHAHSHNNGSRKQFAKKISNRWNRSWERKTIHNQDWDNFLSLRQIHDAWMSD